MRIRIIRVIRGQGISPQIASRPPLGGIDDGAGGFAQRRGAALLGDDREQRLDALEKLDLRETPLGDDAAALAELKKQLPSCKVISGPPVTLKRRP